MANRDPAFLWETEALRTTGPVPGPPPGDRSGRDDWLTLRQASDAVGIPLSTIRNWARKGRIPTALEEFGEGARRMVSLEGVKARARLLGQPVAEPKPPTRHIVEPVESPVIDQDQVAPPPGTMLVPIDAWDKMLLQLGNLHEAGQQLAEARERAARAETEASFLRERLAELRVTSTPEPVTAPIEHEAPTSPEPAKPVKMPRFSAYLWRMAVSGRGRK
jgi:hypothetical protein